MWMVFIVEYAVVSSNSDNTNLSLLSTFLLLDYPLFLGLCLKQVSQDLPKFGNTERRQEAGEQIITVFTDKTVEKHHALVRRPNDSINASCLHVLQ